MRSGVRWGSAPELVGTALMRSSGARQGPRVRRAGPGTARGVSPHAVFLALLLSGAAALLFLDTVVRPRWTGGHLEEGNLEGGHLGGRGLGGRRLESGGGSLVQEEPELVGALQGSRPQLLGSQGAHSLGTQTEGPQAKEPHTARRAMPAVSHQTGKPWQNSESGPAVSHQTGKPSQNSESGPMPEPEGRPGWYNGMSAACLRARSLEACGQRDVVVRAQGDLAARLAALCGAEAVTALTRLSVRVLWSTEPMEAVEDPALDVVRLGGMRAAGKQQQQQQGKGAEVPMRWPEDTPREPLGGARFEDLFAAEGLDVQEDSEQWQMMLPGYVRLKVSLRPCRNVTRQPGVGPGPFGLHPVRDWDRITEASEHKRDTGMGGDQDHPIEFAADVRGDTAQTLQGIQQDPCAFHGPFQRCLASLAPSPAVQQLMAREDWGSLTASTAVYIEVGASELQCLPQLLSWPRHPCAPCPWLYVQQGGACRAHTAHQLLCMEQLGTWKMGGTGHGGGGQRKGPVPGLRPEGEGSKEWGALERRNLPSNTVLCCPTLLACSLAEARPANPWALPLLPLLCLLRCWQPQFSWNSPYGRLMRCYGCRTYETINCTIRRLAYRMLRDPGGPSARFTVGAHFPEEAEAVEAAFHATAPPPHVLEVTRRRAKRCLRRPPSLLRQAEGTLKKLDAYVEARRAGAIRGPDEALLRRQRFQKALSLLAQGAYGLTLNIATGTPEAGRLQDTAGNLEGATVQGGEVGAVVKRMPRGSLLDIGVVDISRMRRETGSQASQGFQRSRRLLQAIGGSGDGTSRESRQQAEHKILQECAQLKVRHRPALGSPSPPLLLTFLALCVCLLPCGLLTSVVPG